MIESMDQGASTGGAERELPAEAAAQPVGSADSTADTARLRAMLLLAHGDLALFHPGGACEGAARSET